MRIVKHAGLLLLALVILHVSIVNAGAALMGGQNPLSTATDTRDGASGIIFVDLTARILQAGTITGWNIYAQQYYSLAPSQLNSDPRDVQMIILRENGPNYQVVGKSPLQNVSTWNQIYHFTLPSSIAVLQNDIIGWYYPKITQGDNYYPPGGVIGFSFGGNSTRWYWPNEGAVPPEVGGTLSQNLFGDGGARTYSLSIEGNPVPIPGALWLLGTGLLGLVGLRRRMKK